LFAVKISNSSHTTRLLSSLQRVTITVKEPASEVTTSVTVALDSQLEEGFREQVDQRSGHYGTALLNITAHNSGK
jgi:hypothetical protein